MVTYNFVASQLQPECLNARSGAPRDVTEMWWSGPASGQEAAVATEDRGFASMERNKQREIASKGGKAAHQKGTAHEWTSEEAREAGRKGGMASHRRKQEQQQGGSMPEGGAGDTDEQMQGTEDMR